MCVSVCTVLVDRSLPQPVIKSSKSTETSLALVLNPARSMTGVDRSGG